MTTNSVTVDPDTGLVTLSLADLQALVGGATTDAAESAVKVSKTKPEPRFQAKVSFTKNEGEDREKYGDITITKHFSGTYVRRMGLWTSDAYAFAEWVLENFDEEK